MKKLVLSLFAFLACGMAFQACDNTKTYAEMLEDEKKAIKEYIKDNNIKVIPQTEFYKNDSTTNLAENEYVQLASGVYMQIVDKGSSNPADTVKKNDKVLVRFEEYGIMSKDSLSNLGLSDVVDEFTYTVTSTSIAGIFTKSSYMYRAYGSAVPAGWLVALTYVRDMAHVKLIVPSKMGHSTAQQRVYPYVYDIRKFQIYK